MEDTGPVLTSAPPQWVKDLPVKKATQPDSWPPKSRHYYDWENWETHKVYSDATRSGFEPSDFAAARSKLDYDYHFKPALSRQELQDTILSRVVNANNKSTGQKQQQPWIVFTAGAMGVGKGYVLSTLYKSNLFPLDQFIKVDPDMLKNEIPELSGYLAQDVETAATKVHRESTQMADVLLEQALMTKSSTLVDGSLRDVDYYSTLFQRVQSLKSFKIAILLVTAQKDTIIHRAEQRAEQTGRAVPIDLLEESMRQAPKSVQQLAPLADVTFEISNNDGESPKLVSGTRQFGETIHNNELTWELFRDTWIDYEDEEQEQETKDEEENNKDSHNDGREEKSLELANKNSKDPASVCHITKLLKLKTKKQPCSLKAKACMLKPMCRTMSSCWDDCKAHESARNIWGKAYPNMCPRCTLVGDGQCGVCIHGNHLCACTECENHCPVRALLKRAKSATATCSISSSSSSALASLTSSLSKKKKKETKK